MEDDCGAKVGCCLERPRLYSVDLEHMIANTKPEPRDLAIAMISEINHQARFDAEFDNGLFILGAVVGFKDVDMSTGEALK